MRPALGHAGRARVRRGTRRKEDDGGGDGNGAVTRVRIQTINRRAATASEHTNKTNVYIGILYIVICVIWMHETSICWRRRSTVRTARASRRSDFIWHPEHCTPSTRDGSSRARARAPHARSPRQCFTPTHGMWITLLLWLRVCEESERARALSYTLTLHYTGF